MKKKSHARKFIHKWGKRECQCQDFYNFFNYATVTTAITTKAMIKKSEIEGAKSRGLNWWHETDEQGG